MLRFSVRYSPLPNERMYREDGRSDINTRGHAVVQCCRVVLELKTKDETQLIRRTDCCISRSSIRSPAVDLFGQHDGELCP